MEKKNFQHKKKASIFTGKNTFFGRKNESHESKITKTHKNDGKSRKKREKTHENVKNQKKP
jgi:ribosomal protein L35AE/L33A